MSKIHQPQHDIARTLRGLLPVQGAPKTLREIRDQVRLLNDIRHNDESLARVIVAYFRDPRFNLEARFLKIDKYLHDEELSGRWTRVRVGPSIWQPLATAGGTPPTQKAIEKKLPDIWRACSRSTQTSFHTWDLLKEHFEVTRDNNRYYRKWLKALSNALEADPRFVIIAIDTETGIPVEWMLAVDREQQVAEAVGERLLELVAFLDRDESPVHLTRDLVHRFFAPRVIDETYDLHTYYKAVSAALADIPDVVRLSIQERERQVEAWCVRGRLQQIIQEHLDSIARWLLTVATPQSADVLSQQILKHIPEFAAVDGFTDKVSQVLAEDMRFVFEHSADGWIAAPPGPVRNLPAFHIFLEHRHPLSEDALIGRARERFPALFLDFNLNDDSRFCRWREDLWGLSQWIDINDSAYEYLCTIKKPLLPSTIISKVCEQYALDSRVSVFTPEADSRFISRQHGRWYYRYAVSDAELDQMLLLLEAMEDGLTLSDLVSMSVNRSADDTDAFERLTGDERFVIIGDRWFSRKKAFYALTDEDVEELLAALYRAGTGLRLSTLIRRTLDREVSLTDAEAKLESDSRFREILSGVWTTSDFQPPSQERRPIFSRPIRSEKIATIPEDEYTVIEDLTERETRSGGERVALHRYQVTRTLSLLDLRNGNLVIDNAIASLVSLDEVQALHFIDELGQEFTGWIDIGNNLLQGLGDWFRARELSFGDKIMVRATDQIGFLEIKPKGQRDERVYQEALQRQDLENLLEDARQTHKSYHDVMVEVMEYFNQTAGESIPLHREDIYNLVNYNRTASRNTIFSTLSLTHCPYEELRYFVPHGHGYWSFDRERRKAFKMKMKELLEKLEQLEAENKRLRQRVTSSQANLTESAQKNQEQEARIAELSTRNDGLFEVNQRLSVANSEQLRQIGELSEQVSMLETQASEQEGELGGVYSIQESLRKELVDIRKERDQLSNSQKEQARHIEELIQSKVSLEGEIVDLQTRMKQLISQNTALQENVGQLQGQVDKLANQEVVLQEQHRQTVIVLQSQVQERQQELENLAADSETRLRQLRGELELERGRAQQIQERLGAFEQSHGERAEEVVQLRTKIDQARSVLQTPLGKGFILLSRALGGADLSDL